MEDMLVRIDGSFGEGGGQILRTAVALSCVTGIPVEITNIRANRPNPGLAMQHLAGIKTAGLLSNAKVEGLRKGSTKILFKPGKVRGGEFKVDVGTAGSISLILQVLIPTAMVAENSVTLTVIGGTDVRWSPPVDYLKNVTLRGVKEMGGSVEVSILQRGYYPKGGGKVIAKIEPSKLKGLNFKAEKSERVRGVSHCSNLPKHVAERQATSAKNELESIGIKTLVEIETWTSRSTGSGITLWCEKNLIGGSSIGEKRKKAEIVGKEAAKQLIFGLNSGAALDEWVGDQLMIFAVLAKGKTSYTVSKITKHQVSNVYVINKFFDCVTINESKRQIDIKGMNLL